MLSLGLGFKTNILGLDTKFLAMALALAYNFATQGLGLGLAPRAALLTSLKQESRAMARN